MSKNKSKVKNTQEFNPKRALRIFTKATVLLILNDLENITLDDLIDALYIENKNNDKDLEYLIREFEKQLLLAKMYPDKFREGLHDFYMDMSKFLKETNKYNIFYELVYISYVQLTRKKNDVAILSYFNILVQQNSYLTFNTKKIPYGVSKKKGLLITDEVGDYLSDINYELHINKYKFETFDDALKLCRKYGYNFKTQEELDHLVNYDRVVNNMIFMNTYFINEDNSFLLPKPYRDLTSSFQVAEIFYKVKPLNLMYEKLSNRQGLLPSNGILITVKNCYDIIEIFLYELIKDDSIILQYKVKFKDNTYLLGFYDIKEMVSLFTFDTGYESYLSQYLIENIVLQNYLNLTCDLTTEEREEFIDFVEEDNPSLPVMIYSKKEKVSENSKESHFRVFDRREYRAELKGVKGYIRKLPLGATASEEAIANAKRLGIELRHNETFVTEFIKKIYKKN